MNDEILGVRALIAITVTIDGTEFRLVRDGLEWRRAGTLEWNSVDTDNEPDAHELSAFNALETMHGEL